MVKDIDKLSPDDRIKVLKEIIDKKNREIEAEKKALEKAEKQKKDKITEAIIDREQELQKEFKDKKDQDISDLIVDEDKDLESKLFGLKKEEEDLMSSYLSSKSPTQNIYDDIKVLYTEAQNGGVSPEMAELAGNMQYALQQKYEDVKSGDYNADTNIAEQANVATKIANDILSLYTGTHKNENLRKY